ncbi:MAG: DUF2971 domain-containing protein [Paracoccaceae bacterium]
MIVYKFLPAKWGRLALRQRKLKVAVLEELNDPFELGPVDRTNAKYRRVFNNWRAKMMADKVIICFSKSWENPVIWSHYADCHRGMCLGFEVEDSILLHIAYQNRLIHPDEFVSEGKVTDPSKVLALATVKFSHWSYENEARVFLRKAECEEVLSEVGEVHLVDFDKVGRLSQVVLGCNYEHDMQDIVPSSVLKGVDVITTRTAFADFKVTRQLAKKLQKRV